MSALRQFDGNNSHKLDGHGMLIKKPKRSSLCVNNHHKWVVEKQSPFDVKSGKLVTTERCSRCGKQRIRTS